MSQSENLLEFLDGSLSEENEQQLFDALSHERELRTELRQHVSISRAVVGDRDAFAPPGYLDAAVLAGVGIPMTPATTGTAVATSSAGFRVIGLIGAFVLGVLLATGGLYITLLNGGLRFGDYVCAAYSGKRVVASAPLASTNTGTSATVVSPSVSAGSASATQSDNAPAASATTASVAPRVIIKEVPVIKYRTRYINNTPAPDNKAKINISSNDQGDAPITTSVNGREVQPTALRQSENPTDWAPKTQPVGTTTLQAVPLLPMPAPTMRQSDSASRPIPSKVVAELRMQSQGSINSSSSRNPESVFPENFAAGLYYKLDNTFALGIEGGVERYTQSLFINHVDTLMIDQRPLMTWGGVSARYSLNNLAIPQLQPFVQMTAGATSTGPLLRGRAGARYGFNIMNREVSLLFAGELSSLFYRYNGQYSATGRWGITYGLEVALW